MRLIFLIASLVSTFTIIACAPARESTPKASAPVVQKVAISTEADTPSGIQVDNYTIFPTDSVSTTFTGSFRRIDSCPELQQSYGAGDPNRQSNRGKDYFGIDILSLKAGTDTIGRPVHNAKVRIYISTNGGFKTETGTAQFSIQPAGEGARQGTFDFYREGRELQIHLLPAYMNNGIPTVMIGWRWDGAGPTWNTICASLQNRFKIVQQ